MQDSSVYSERTLRDAARTGTFFSRFSKRYDPFQKCWQARDNRTTLVKYA